MATTKEFLSASTNGRPIKVAAGATPGTTIHTADATAKDEVWMYATNTDATDIPLTVEFGGTTNPDDQIKATVPAGETVLVVPGIPLTNSLVARAFAGTANKITISGYVNRIV